MKPEEAPVSLNTIGEVEIKRNPGANRDISKALQSLRVLRQLRVFEMI